MGRLHTGGVTSAWAILPEFVVGFWFYGIIWARLTAVVPLGRSFLQSAGNLWLLFMGYTIWLGFFPPTGSKSLREWGAWALVIAGLGAILVIEPWRPAELACLL